MTNIATILRGKSLADYTNSQLRLALGAVLYTNTADMWKQYLNNLGYRGSVSEMLQKYYVEYNVPQNFRNYINAGAGIFSPQQLFADGSKGVLYDNNDFYEPTLWRRNLLTYSEQLNVSPWSVSNATVTANQTVSPDGTTTADLITATANGGNVRQFFVSSAGVRTFSCYVKKGNVSVITFAVTNISIAFTFNLDTGLVTGGLYQANAFAQDVGNGWYRIGVWLDTVAATNYGPQITLTTLNDTVYAWGFQMEVGATATDYQRITNFNSDFLAAFPNTTFFEDSAGTIPAKVNGLVGLQLDKSGGLVLGADLVTNGGFDADSTWTKSAGVTIAGGKAVFSGVASGAGLAQTTSAVSGKFYKVRVTISNWSSASLLCRLTSGSFVTIASGNGTFEALILAGGNSLQLYSSTAGGTFDIDDVSLVEVPGNHRYQTTTGSKPVLRGTPTGGNLVTNGGFDTDTAWTKGTGWAIGSGVATATAASAPITSGTMTPVVGKVYRITYTITRSAGSIGISIGGVFGATRSASGTYVEYLTASATTPNLRFTTTLFSGTLDNVEIVDVSADSVTAPYGLQFDGFDDFMRTAAVDFSATDKMGVCMGVRKLSDAVVGMIAELSGIFSINAGAWALYNVTNSQYYFASGGSPAGVFGQVNSSPIFAPASSVLTATGSISTPNVTLRINAVQVATSSASQGSGNFGVYPIYFGRRNGNEYPFNGLDYGGVIVGKALTASQLSNLERWVAQRTGVTL